MDVINDNVALLSNYEVFSVLRELYLHRRPDSGLQQLATVSYETLRYLETTPCRRQSPESLTAFARNVAPFDLTKAERLQLLNHRPTSMVVLSLLVEEIEERLTTDEQVNELLNVVTTTLPADISEEAAAAGGGQCDEQEMQEELEEENVRPGGSSS
jgi:hypothetical protein